MGQGKKSRKCREGCVAGEGEDGGVVGGCN